MKQLTESEAVEFYDSGKWKAMTDKDLVALQLFQERLCVPWGVFHEAIGKVLGRPIWTHEFTKIELIREEYLGKREKPTLDEIISQLPQEKVILVVTGDEA